MEPKTFKGERCAKCGWREHSGIHLPALTGPRKGKPWGHAFVKPNPSEPNQWASRERK